MLRCQKSESRDQYLSLRKPCRPTSLPVSTLHNMVNKTTGRNWGHGYRLNGRILSPSRSTDDDQRWCLAWTPRLSACHCRRAAAHPAPRKSWRESVHTWRRRIVPAAGKIESYSGAGAPAWLYDVRAPASTAECDDLEWFGYFYRAAWNATRS